MDVDMVVTTMFTNKVITLAVTIGSAIVGEAATALNVPGDFTTIQACIDAAVSGVDECVVAPGTYHETINFLGKAITVRSSGGAEVTTIDATGIGGSVVTCASGEGPDTVLDGFTMTGGTGTENIFYAKDGGGMYNYDSSPTITNCTFSGNKAIGSEGLGAGGGMYNYNSSPTVTNCTFGGNSAYAGGGMCNSYSSPSVSNCSFGGNASEFGGGLLNSQSSPTVTNCTFSGNSVLWGAGGAMYNGAGSPTVTNCTFSMNVAIFGIGGGMYNESSNPMVTNCTFSGNTANGSFEGGGGGMYNYASSPTLTNCILWDDSPDEIASSEQATPAFHFSDMQGGLPVGAIDGGGNIDLDPMFMRPPDPGPDGIWDGVDDDYGDLRLQAGSPCINAGDPASVPQPGETDLEGHARVLCERVDMGAYEFGIGDYDCDQTVNLEDFAGWSLCMNGPQSGPYVSGCEAFDFDGDGDVDFLDFAWFQRIMGP